MATFGRNVLTTTGAAVQVTADGRPNWKPGGITLDWSTVAAVASTDYTIPIELTVVKVGLKFLRYGQVLTKITHKPAQTLTSTGPPTAGTSTVTGTRPDTGATTTQTLQWNSTVAQTQTAMDAIFGAGNTVVSGSGGLNANVQTITFQGALQDLAPIVLTTDSTGLTGGTVAAAVVVAGSDYGKFGPYDPAATDGRQTLTRGECFVLNETDLQSGLISGLPTGATDNPGVFDGGRVWKDRLLVTTGSHSLAAGPTFTEFEAAFPNVSYVEN